MKHADPGPGSYLIVCRLRNYLVLQTSLVNGHLFGPFLHGGGKDLRPLAAQRILDTVSLEAPGTNRSARVLGIRCRHDVLFAIGWQGLDILASVARIEHHISIISVWARFSNPWTISHFDHRDRD